MPVPDERTELFAALAEPHRLAAIEQLWLGDLTPGELGSRLGLPSNLLAHHLDVLTGVGLLHRRRSTGDGRRRYLVLNADPIASFGLAPRRPPVAAPVFLSETGRRAALAADRWWFRTGLRARALDLPAFLRLPTPTHATVTVSDRAREHGGVRAPHLLHWGVDEGDDASFRREMDRRIGKLASVMDLPHPAPLSAAEETPSHAEAVPSPPLEPERVASVATAGPDAARNGDGGPEVRDDAPLEPDDVEARLRSMVRALRGTLGS